jgi:hypothetical protein
MLTAALLTLLHLLMEALTVQGEVETFTFLIAVHPQPHEGLHEF